jgi:cellulose synthase/poly-beta-1,6-N-acetylglucosamine synthase-like glycosyltransferase
MAGLLVIEAAAMTHWLEVVFWGSAAFALYTLAGYPLWLAAIARLRPRPVCKEFRPRSVTVLMPVRNGERWLAAKLDSLLALNYPPNLLEILIVSDGSTDRTEEIARSYRRLGNIRLLESDGEGKAVALNLGLAEATGEILFLTDVRQILEPDALRNLVACFADPSVGAASGELIIRAGDSLEEYTVGLYWKYEKWIRRRQSRVDSVPGASGCIYAIRRELVKPLPAGTIDDDMYLPLEAIHQGYRVIFEEQALAFDYPTKLDSEFRRKLRTQAGVYQILRLSPWLLTRENRILFEFLSHKVARLLLPWAILLITLTSFALPEPWRVSALWTQAFFYLLAAVDRWLPRAFVVKRISAPSRTFVVLLAAAACAVRILFTSSQQLWTETRVSTETPVS